MNTIYSDAHEPQSIIHQILRASKRVKDTVKRCNGLRVKSCSGGGSSVCSTRSSWGITTTSSQLSDDAFTSRDGTSSSSEDYSHELYTIAASDTDSTNRSQVNTKDIMQHESISTSTSHKTNDEAYNEFGLEDGNEVDNEKSWSEAPILPLDTINQNDFMIQCMIDTSRPCLIHFFVDDTVASEIMDRELGKLHAFCVHKKARCRFMRLNATTAPFITSKLQVSAHNPSVICIHNGQVFVRINDVDALVKHPGDVKRWALSTGLLDK
jgi:hypothetical protein